MKKSQHNAKKKLGSPEVLIFFAMVLTPSIIIGYLLGAGVAAIMGGFITMFTYISCTGGSLRANLIRFASLGPLVAIGSIAPRFLAEVTVVGGVALAIGFVFLASVLPLRGRRYAATSLGMGMGVLLGYALPLGNLNIYQLLMAAAAGLAATLLLLVVLALKDPTGPTRNAVAGLLESTERGFATAFDSWTADGAPRWLASVMVAAGRYHLARNVLEVAPELSADVTATLKWAETTAQEIATHVRLKDPAAALEISDPPEVLENVGNQSEPLRQSIIAALSNAA